MQQKKSELRGLVHVKMSEITESGKIENLIETRHKTGFLLP